MIATCMAGRGLDTVSVANVVNIEFPSNSVAYLHRAGRTGRRGESGTVTNLVSEKRDKGLVDQLIGLQQAGRKLQSTFSRKRSLANRRKGNHTSIRETKPLNETDPSQSPPKKDRLYSSNEKSSNNPNMRWDGRGREDTDTGGEDTDTDGEGTDTDGEINAPQLGLGHSSSGFRYTKHQHEDRLRETGRMKTAPRIATYRSQLLDSDSDDDNLDTTHARSESGWNSLSRDTHRDESSGKSLVRNYRHSASIPSPVFEGKKSRGRMEIMLQSVGTREASPSYFRSKLTFPSLIVTSPSASNANAFG